jgi:carboxyl-terminal processing protease
MGLLVGIIFASYGLKNAEAWTSPKPFHRTSPVSSSVSVPTPVSTPLYVARDATDKDKDTSVDAVIRSCKSACASAVLSGLLLLFPGPIGMSTSTDSPFSLLLPARAAETTTINIGSNSNSVMLASESESVQVSALDQVWTLINKYYIDRTFNGQDWDAAYDKYKVPYAKTTNEEQQMGLITEMVKSLGDKYSRMLDREMYTAIQKYDLIGVGVTLMPNSAKQIIVGAPPIAGSAADKAGLKVGDFVTAVNSIPTGGRTAFDIIDQVSENPSAKTISMTIRHKDNTGTDGTEVTMQRLFQEVKNPIKFKISETRSDGTKVGYVRISEFNSLVKAKLEEALKSLEASGANAYVIDLRMNTGGAFQSAVEISSLFLEDRVATTVIDSGNTQLPFRTAKGRLAIDATDPVAVWIDGYSASASEVLAGALHDNCRAVLMGDKSFGKGLIQAVYGLDNGAGLVLTVAHYATPDGTDIQGVGIFPDIQGHVPLPLPGMSTDTSGVDFNDIRSRLDPSICHAPE